jgi:hypothetical protein
MNGMYEGYASKRNAASPQLRFKVYSVQEIFRMDIT